MSLITCELNIYQICIIVIFFLLNFSFVVYWTFTFCDIPLPTLSDPPHEPLLQFFYLFRELVHVVNYFLGLAVY
jgi:hypothetical protein